MKYWDIDIEGIDKSGKDLLCGYLDVLSNHKYSLNVRGILSNLVYSERYNRHYDYDLTNLKNKIIILLTVDFDELNIRCKLSNEPVFDYETDDKLFLKYADILQNTSNVRVFRYDTSSTTFYQIAKKIIQKLQKMEEENGSIS